MRGDDDGRVSRMEHDLVEEQQQLSGVRRRGGENAEEEKQVRQATCKATVGELSCPLNEGRQDNVRHLQPYDRAALGSASESRPGLS